MNLASCFLTRAPKESYSEAYQSNNIKFAFVSKEPGRQRFKELHSAVKCRDFLGDVLFSEAEKQDINIYDFKWGKNRSPIDRDSLRLSIHFPSKDSFANFQANINILTNVEKCGSTKPSTIKTVAGDPLCLVVESDKIWLSSVFLISLFTFILKIMGYSFKNPDDWISEFPKMGKNDSSYYRGKEKELLSVLNNIKLFANPKVVTGWIGQEKNNYDVHNSSGFSTILKNYRGMEGNVNADILKGLVQP